MITSPPITSVVPGAVQAPEVAQDNISKPGEIKNPRAHQEWWETERGQQTEIYFRAWGLTTRGRRDTGDSSYVPQMDAVPGGAGSNRSHPSNVSDVLLRFVDVDRVMLKVPNGPRRLTWWAFVECVSTRHSHRAIFRDGSFGEWTQGPQPRELAPLIEGYEEDIRQVWEWDFDRYPALLGEAQYWLDWNIKREKHLARSLVDVGKFVAEELGL